MTLTRSAEILEQHRVSGKAPIGDHIAVQPDLFLMPEYAISLIEAGLDALGGPTVSPRRILAAADHFAPPATIERAEILSRVEQIIDRYGWTGVYRRFDGICHQLLLEDERLTTGSLVVGADSHTVTAGAKGAWAAGFGSHDLLYGLVRGYMWIAAGPAVAIVIHGSFSASDVFGKDIILECFRILGANGFHRRSIEFFDHTDNGLTLDQRATICNMVVDGGAANGLFVPESYEPNSTAYEQFTRIDLGNLVPKLACPGSPFGINDVDEFVGTSITQAYLGSCNSGRLEDFAVAARIVRGRTVHPGVKAIAIPSSRSEYLKALDAGHIRDLLAAGFVIGHPSCGPCGGIDKGILGSGDICIATMNRNFQGRMGSKDASIWLANPAVVAEAAITGRISRPAAIQDQ